MPLYERAPNMGIYTSIIPIVISSLINYSFYIFIHLWSFYPIYVGFFYRNNILLFQLRMILRSHTYLKVYKCWRILSILKTATIKCPVIFFKKYFNFQGFYIVYILNWWFLGWKTFTPSKLGKGLQNLQNGKYCFGENPLKIAHGLNFAPKIIPDGQHWYWDHNLWVNIF